MDDIQYNRIVGAKADSALQAALEHLALPFILVGHRAITPGDGSALLPTEAPAWNGAAERVRQSSGAARIVVRELLARLGHSSCPVPKAAGGAPAWPEGIIGSLAHDQRFAVATVARRADSHSIGIDIEPAESLPADLLDIVATPAERIRIGADLLMGRALFVIKEAVYKAVYPLDRTFLEHHDVVVDLDRRVAEVRNGRPVNFRYCLTPRVLAIAFVTGSC